MTRTLVATPGPEPRNEITWTNGTTTATGDGTGNTRWLTLDVKITR